MTLIAVVADCDEAACVLEVNNQNPTEVMGGGGGQSVVGVCIYMHVCVAWGGQGSGTLPPRTLYSVKLHG